MKQNQGVGEFSRCFSYTTRSLVGCWRQTRSLLLHRKLGVRDHASPRHSQSAHGPIMGGILPPPGLYHSGQHRFLGGLPGHEGRHLAGLGLEVCACCSAGCPGAGAAWSGPRLWAHLLAVTCPGLFRPNPSAPIHLLTPAMPSSTAGLHARPQSRWLALPPALQRLVWESRPDGTQDQRHH